MELMQLTPATWLQWKARLDLGSDPYDPRDNILARAAYLKELHERYGSPGFLAAYHAGALRYIEYLATRRTLPTSTTDNLALIRRFDDAVTDLLATALSPRVQNDRRLFVGGARSGERFDEQVHNTGDGRLFVVLTHADRQGERSQTANTVVQDEDAP